MNPSDQRQKIVYHLRHSKQHEYEHIYVSSLSPNSHRVMWREPDDNGTRSGLHYGRGTLKTGNLNLLCWTVSMPDHVPEGDIISVLQGYKQTCPLFHKVTLSLHSKAVHYINVFEKNSPEQRQSLSLLVRCTECKRPTENCPPNSRQLHTWAILMEKEVCLRRRHCQGPRGWPIALEDTGLESHSQGESERNNLGRCFQGGKLNP